jgi:hypothetical protein
MKKTLEMQVIEVGFCTFYTTHIWSDNKSSRTRHRVLAMAALIWYDDFDISVSQLCYC